MANMSYCRFENTLYDLNDCERHFDHISSKKELEAARHLITVARRLAEIDPKDLAIEEDEEDEG